MIMMKICGIQKTTLLDFPGHVATTIFIGGCNFKCPFCHNKSLLERDVLELLTVEQLLTFLEKRKQVLEGVCITGGEPTLYPELSHLCESIHKLGYLVKLDSNGSKPDFLKQLCSQGLVDYIAMDIKNCPEKYAQSSKCKNADFAAIEESIFFLINGNIPYEFRTTIVKELHTAEDMTKIGAWLQGADKYFLQNYADSPQVLCPGLSGRTKEELLEFASLVKPFVKEVGIRGVDH